MECPICYEAITAETGVVTTSCNHSYHFSCISGWYIKQEKGTCPCCRKEMNDKEDFPDVPDGSSGTSDESYEFEVEFTRSELQEFIRAHGGHLTEQMSDAICTVVGSFTHMELNSLLVGNTGQTLTEGEWNDLLHRGNEDEEDSMRITIAGDGRRVYLNEHETAATTIQFAWRTQKAVQGLIMLSKN